jgi:hypothetical protein
VGKRSVSQRAIIDRAEGWKPARELSVGCFDVRFACRDPARLVDRNLEFVRSGQGRFTRFTPWVFPQVSQPYDGMVRPIYGSTTCQANLSESAS